MLNKTAAAILLITLLSACAPQTARFLSEPSGAQVTIDGEMIGETPCEFHYGLGAGGDYEVVVTKNGYETVRQVIEAEETDVAARNRWLVAGVIWSPLWLGAVFTKKLKEGYEFVLKKATPQLTAQAEREYGEQYR
jgi:hypothetical protein